MSFACRPNSGGSSASSVYNGASAYWRSAGAGASVDVNINTDGTITETGTFVDASTGFPTRYYFPTTVGIGSSFWVRATLQSGSAWGTGNMGAWTQITSNQNWHMNVSHSGDKANTTLFEFATDSGGLNIVASGIITAECDGTF